MINFNGKYTNEEQLSIYRSLVDYTKQRLNSEKIIIDDLYAGTYSFESAEKFRKNYTIVSRLSKALSSGMKGEERAYNSLKIRDYRSRVLKSVQTPSYNPQWSVEHDIIVITDKAIFTVEVKNISDPKVVITEQGVMIKESSRGEIRVDKNVVQQSRWHQVSIRKLLQGTRFENVSVIPVLMFANDMCTFENRFSSADGGDGFRCCYCATADKAIFDCDSEGYLTKDDMDEIEEILTSASSNYPTRRFDICVDVKEYTEILESFINDVKEERNRKEQTTEYGVDEIKMYLNGLLLSNSKA